LPRALGASALERAVLDAFCRARDATFSTAARENLFGIRPGNLHAELGDAQPRDFLPPAPLRSVISRHTVGLADSLVAAEIPSADRVNDGLPESLEACVAEYGLTHFKIKLAGEV